MRKKKALERELHLDLWVHINDWGHGVRPEEVKRILKPFYQFVDVYPISKLPKDN